MGSSPPPFLSVILHRDDAAYDAATRKHVVGVTGLCAGFEQGAWRCQQLSEYLIEVWLPEFALRHSELEGVDRYTMARLVKQAARAVYTSKKFENRGEFGELLLHSVLAQEMHSLPAVSKIYYKSAPNDTVKGFDAVHVVPNGAGLELWLGEAKFYGSASRAMREAISSLKRLSQTKFLRDEFAIILRMLDDSWPHADQLRRLLDKSTSLDEIFSTVCIPVLITYDSATLAAHKSLDASYEAAIEKEWLAHHGTFSGKSLPANVRVHLILVPLNNKKSLIRSLDKELRRWH